LFFFLTEDLNVTLTSPKVFGGEIRGACKGPRHGLGRKFVRVCTIFAAKGHRLKQELEATLDELNWFSASIGSSVKPAFIAISMNSGVVGDSIPSSESALEDQNLPNKRLESIADHRLLYHWTVFGPANRSSQTMVVRLQVCRPQT
jgi:hypothetical protein